RDNPPKTTASTTHLRRSSERAIPAAPFSRRECGIRNYLIRESPNRFSPFGYRSNRRYSIEICEGVSANEMAEAGNGTVRDGRLVHPMNPERSGVEIKTIRGD